MSPDPKTAWETYRDEELAALTAILRDRGYALDQVQPHLLGERYLMQAVTTESGRKLILLGRNADGKRVVIKATSDPYGARELAHEHLCREVMRTIPFAYQAFFSPPELLFTVVGNHTISIQEYLAQDLPFLERPIEEQFSLALSSFKTQEGAHATTYEHTRLIAHTFGSMHAADYLRRFAEFVREVERALPEAAGLHDSLHRTEGFLSENARVIEQYEGFLTHTDFVPHNIRVVGNEVYLLDLSSIRFGNKYEGWARFVNFMTLYNPPLAEALLTYVKDNRSPEEYLSLRLMRAYRLGEIISYYVKTLPKSTGDLHTLNRERIDFWHAVLDAVITDTLPSEATRLAYIARRDTLRSPDEKRRQEGLH